ncbi:MAG: glycoside hydrolase family 1 protein [Bacteroidia bacterium]
MLYRKDFGEKFFWGVATAAYQIEGAPNADDKEPSIWDEFSHKKGKIARNENGDIACDFYHRYLEDIRLLKELHIPNFRLSLSWSRLMKEESPNPKGIAFYHQVIDNFLAANIEPWITLYHWDLPARYQNAWGGWRNRKILAAFEKYVTLCAKEYGDKVKYWMVLNEPLAFSALGYLLGIHAPGEKGMKNFLPAVHHITLAQAMGGKILRALAPKAIIGTTFSCAPTEPYKPSLSHTAAARRWDALLNRLFIEPALGMGYPVDTLPILYKIDRYALPQDYPEMKFDFDFIGVQNYSREVIKKHIAVPYLKGRPVPPKKRKVPYHAMGWEVYPKSLYLILKQFARYPIKRLIVTENGYAAEGEKPQPDIPDTYRIEYFRQVLYWLHQAQKEGVPVEGYFLWTYTDNFEWAEGYRPQFGIVYTHPTDLRRFPKKSAWWYRDFLLGKEGIPPLPPT